MSTRKRASEYEEGDVFRFRGIDWVVVGKHVNHNAPEPDTVTLYLDDGHYRDWVVFAV